MKRQEKEIYLNNIISSLAKEASFFVLMHNTVKANQWILLRSSVKKSGGGIFVIKKRLAKLVFKKLNYTNVMSSDYKGNIMIITTGDNCFGVLNSVKTVIDTAPKNLSFLGGVLVKKSIKPTHLDMISKIRSEQDIYVSLVRTLMHPLVHTARILTVKTEENAAAA